MRKTKFECFLVDQNSDYLIAIVKDDDTAIRQAQEKYSDGSSFVMTHTILDARTDKKYISTPIKHIVIHHAKGRATKMNRILPGSAEDKVLPRVPMPAACLQDMLNLHVVDQVQFDTAAAILSGPDRRRTDTVKGRQHAIADFTVVDCTPQKDLKRIVLSAWSEEHIGAPERANTAGAPLVLHRLTLKKKHAHPPP